MILSTFSTQSFIVMKVSDILLTKKLSTSRCSILTAWLNSETLFFYFCICCVSADHSHNVSYYEIIHESDSKLAHDHVENENFIFNNSVHVWHWFMSQDKPPLIKLTKIFMLNNIRCASRTREQMTMKLFFSRELRRWYYMHAN